MYRWIDHTGEQELEIEAETEEGVYEEALRAFAELVGEASGEAARRQVRVRAFDRARLLAEWLEELVFLAETEGFVPVRAERLELPGGELRAIIQGVLASPPHLVKAVTYHRLSFEREAEGWRATAVLDV
jgi:SHS2 domain-containing protein